mmetsp:Transcript_62318/g.157526  ORF Transcript_62318/g.157526 Transcript_62318/m.157526 type:complete len:219 (+) Transcript_62318:81-737(+)
MQPRCLWAVARPRSWPCGGARQPLQRAQLPAKLTSATLRPSPGSTSSRRARRRLTVRAAVLTSIQGRPLPNGAPTVVLGCVAATGPRLPWRRLRRPRLRCRLCFGPAPRRSCTGDCSRPGNFSVGRSDRCSDITGSAALQDLRCAQPLPRRQSRLSCSGAAGRSARGRTALLPRRFAEHVRSWLQQGALTRRGATRTALTCWSAGWMPRAPSRVVLLL